MLFAKHITFSILVVENAKVLNCFFDVTINHLLISLIVLELNQHESGLRRGTCNDGRQPREVGCKQSLLACKTRNNSHAKKKDPNWVFWWKRWELNPRPKSETKDFLHV